MYQGQGQGYFSTKPSNTIQALLFDFSRVGQKFPKKETHKVMLAMLTKLDITEAEWENTQATTKKKEKEKKNKH